MAEVLVVVCEARSDFEITSCLADRVLKEHGPPWLAENLESCRTWNSGDGEAFITWPQLKGKARILGYDQAKGRSVHEARKAIVYAELLGRRAPVRGLILVRDLDTSPDRRTAYQAASQEVQAFAVVVATPNPEREAWILHGFEPSTDAEKKRLAKIQRDLGFDPAKTPERLRGKPGEDRDIKSVAKHLTGDDRERERMCYESTPLSTLRERGCETFLTAYLDDVQRDLLPRLTGEPAR